MPRDGNIGASAIPLPATGPTLLSTGTQDSCQAAVCRGQITACADKVTQKPFGLLITATNKLPKAEILITNRLR